jgi:hypothetical protein
MSVKQGAGGAGGAQESPDQAQKLLKMRVSLGSCRLLGPVQESHGLLHPCGGGPARLLAPQPRKSSRRSVGPT